MEFEQIEGNFIQIWVKLEMFP